MTKNREIESIMTFINSDLEQTIIRDLKNYSEFFEELTGEKYKFMEMFKFQSSLKNRLKEFLSNGEIKLNVVESASVFISGDLICAERTLDMKTDNEKADYVLLKILRFMNGLPVSRIKRCDECSSTFIQQSAKEKTFCSERCMRNKTARENREKMKKEDPKAYQKILDATRERSAKARKNRL